MKKGGIAIIVPKAHEFVAFESAFNIPIMKKKALGALESGPLFYEFECKCNEESTPVTLFFLNDQTNPVSERATREILSKFKPSVAFLIGTSAGSKKYTKIGDVVVASSILDVRESKIGKAKTYYHSKQICDGNTKIKSDTQLFIERIKDSNHINESFNKTLQEHYTNRTIPQDFANCKPSLYMKIVASGDGYLANPVNMEEIWKLDEGEIFCYDMESAGFCNACKNSDTQHLVVRGISDFGHNAKRENRTPATISAAVFLRNLIENGLFNYPYRSFSLPESTPMKQDDKTKMYLIDSKMLDSEQVVKMAATFLKNEKSISAFWGAHAYDTTLKKYFAEISKNRKVSRLVGIHSIKKSHVLDHVMIMKDSIIKGDYEIYFTSSLNHDGLVTDKKLALLFNAEIANKPRYLALVADSENMSIVNFFNNYFISSVGIAANRGFCLTRDNVSSNSDIGKQLDEIYRKIKKHEDEKNGGK